MDCGLWHWSRTDAGIARDTTLDMIVGTAVRVKKEGVRCDRTICFDSDIVRR